MTYLDLIELPFGALAFSYDDDESSWDEEGDFGDESDEDEEEFGGEDEDEGYDW